MVRHVFLSKLELSLAIIIRPVFNAFLLTAAGTIGPVRPQNKRKVSWLKFLNVVEIESILGSIKYLQFHATVRLKYYCKILESQIPNINCIYSCVLNIHMLCHMIVHMKDWSTWWTQ